MDMFSNGVIMVLSTLTLLILVIVNNGSVSKKELLHPNFPKVDASAVLVTASIAHSPGTQC